MGLKDILHRSTLAEYSRKIKSAPREVILSPPLLISAMLYATSAIPLSESVEPQIFVLSSLTSWSTAWDQGSASTVSSLPAFREQFGISADAGASSTKYLVSLVYVGDAAGAAMSFFINDQIGRLWSFRLYTFIWIVGQLVAIFSPGAAGLYASRIISGLGIGSLSVTGMVSIVEIAPAEIRGVLSAWYSIGMGIALMTATFCVYGIELHVGKSHLQYQIVWFSPCIFMFLWIVASFFLCESPRWLLLHARDEEAVSTLVTLRRLPSDHPRIQEELRGIRESIQLEVGGTDDHSPFQIVSIAKETFIQPANLRRVQQAIIMYALPQFSGGNSVTNYFIPILEIVGLGGSSTGNLFLNGMYALAKFFFSLFASFIFIDALGRRNSLLFGITLQMLSDIYLAAYIKIQQQSGASQSAGEAALAAIFVHALGYSVGMSTDSLETWRLV